MRPSTVGAGPGGALTVAVGGGKGGVGKSVIAANLGVAMARLGFRVIAVDADFGAANLHTMFGIDRPRVTVTDFLERRLGSLEEALVPSGVPRLFVLPGMGAVPGAANMAHARKLKLLRHIRRLDADAILIDCGAGSSYTTLDFFNAADRRIVVVAPQLVSMQNAYAFVKGSTYRAMRSWTVNHRESELFDHAHGSSETERVQQLIARIAAEDPELARGMTRCTRAHEVSVLGNQLEHDRQLNLLHALARMVADFLEVRATVAGGLHRRPLINRSVTERRPFLRDSVATPEGQLMLELAEDLLSTDLCAVREGRARPVDGAAPRSAHPPPARALGVETVPPEA